MNDIDRLTCEYDLCYHGWKQKRLQFCPHRRRQVKGGRGSNPTALDIEKRMPTPILDGLTFMSPPQKGETHAEL